MNPSQRCKHRWVICLATLCMFSAGSAIMIGSSGSYMKGSPDAALRDDPVPNTIEEEEEGPSNSSWPELETLPAEASRTGLMKASVCCVFATGAGGVVMLQISGALSWRTNCFTSTFFSCRYELNRISHTSVASTGETMPAATPMPDQSFLYPASTQAMSQVNESWLVFVDSP